MYFGFYECPVCGAYLKAFLPGGLRHAVLVEKSVIGGGPRSSVFCPACRSTDRERLVYLFLKNRPHLLARGTKLLHIAPELNLSGWLRCLPELHYVTADLCKSRVDLHFDLTSIPLPDSTFHAIICNHVLEHIPDDANAISELFRILKPGGWAILQTPISPSLPHTYEDLTITNCTERERAFGQHDHVRIYAMDYVDRLKTAGFGVEIFHWRQEDTCFGGNANKFGLNEEEKLFFASRAYLQ